MNLIKNRILKLGLYIGLTLIYMAIGLTSTNEGKIATIGGWLITIVFAEFVFGNVW